MDIVKTPDKIAKSYKKRGRPNKYPFDKIQPGFTLKIINSSPGDLQRVRSSLYQFKISNRLDWKILVRLSNNIIYVSRY